MALVCVRRWELLSLLTVLYAAGAFAFLGVSPLSPFLLEGFALTRFEVGLLLPAVYIGGLLCSLPAGRVADRYGVRVCLAGGLLLGAAMLVAAAAAGSFSLFLGCLVVVGIGWSFVNPPLGKAIVELFGAHERGLAMGVKQMGQTVGGIASALVLPALAERSGWRTAMAMGGVVVAVLVGATWRPLALITGDGAAPDRRATPVDRDPWWWAAHPALVMFLVAGTGLGMVQSGFLSYLPLFAVEDLGFSTAGAGGILAMAQAGGAAARLGLGAVSDRSGRSNRVPWLVATSAMSAVAFTAFAWFPPSSSVPTSIVALCAGAGALGWVGLFMVLAAEVGGPRQAGAMTGVGVAAMLLGILVGGPVFGLIVDRGGRSYSTAWVAFALISAGTGLLLWRVGRAMPPRRAG